MYDVIVIGGGPAGLTASLYTARAGKRVLLLEKEVCGGQMARAAWVENYPGCEAAPGEQLAKQMQKQAEDSGVELVYDTVTAVTRDGVVVAEGGRWKGRCVIAANGLIPRALDAAGQERLLGRGVSYCAHCDGPLFRDKTVAVVGGGNTAAYEVRYLSQICRHVHWIHRREVFTAQASILEQLGKQENITMHPSTQVTEFCGQSRLTGLRLAGKETGILPVEGAFIAIGHQPASEFLKNLPVLDEKGYLLANSRGETAVPWLFGAGDACKKQLRQIVTATADGAIAAASALEFLQ